MTNTITITGNTGRDPELRFIPSGKAVLNGVVADTPRRFNRDTNQWEDAGETLWLNWSVWGADAEYLADHIVKGTKVTVTGRLKARTYEKDGATRTVNEITAESIAVHQKDGQQQSQPGRGGDDPWANNNNNRAPF